MSSLLLTPWGRREHDLYWTVPLGLFPGAKKFGRGMRERTVKLNPAQSRGASGFTNKDWMETGVFSKNYAENERIICF